MNAHTLYNGTMKSLQRLGGRFCAGAVSCRSVCPTDAPKYNEYITSLTKNPYKDHFLLMPMKRVVPSTRCRRASLRGLAFARC
ncbi:hypothetical protein IEO21_05383 [Rhodonia placenta]|uniref:Uncharacterized protein n=1 Tax=Rhodonia placenta TaxID=104341 RepID=A0A8H7U2B3_9APHY|nr:hypothetical protein IEO21_05383 [Postia placenta]